MSSRSCVVVIGGSGFLGRNVLREMSGRGIRAIAPRVRGHVHSSEFWRTMAKFSRETNVSAIINCAGARLKEEEGSSEDEARDANVYLPRALAQTARDSGASFIHVGSRWQVGERGEGPNGRYAQLKEEGEHAAREILAGSYSDMTSLLIRDTYGQGDTRTTLVNDLIAAATNSSALNLTSGHQRIDLVEVSRLVRALVDYVESGLKRSAYTRYEVGSETPPSVREVVDLFEEVSGFILELRWGAIPYRGLELFAMKRVYPWLDGWNPNVWQDDFAGYVSSQFGLKVFGDR